MNLHVRYEALNGADEVIGEKVISAVDKNIGLNDFIMDLHRQGLTGVVVTWCQPTTRPVGDILEPGREGRKAMPNEKDPRTDRSTDGPKQPAPQGTPSKAPGGAGTGTKGDPANEPAAQPDAGTRR